MIGEDGKHFKEKTRTSIIWKEICWGSGLLNRGLKWRVVNGEATRFWVDVWLEDVPLSELALNPIGEVIKLKKVRKCWMENGGGNGMN